VSRVRARVNLRVRVRFRVKVRLKVSIKYVQIWTIAPNVCLNGSHFENGKDGNCGRKERDKFAIPFKSTVNLYVCALTWRSSFSFDLHVPRTRPNPSWFPTHFYFSFSDLEFSASSICSSQTLHSFRQRLEPHFVSVITPNSQISASCVKTETEH